MNKLNWNLAVDSYGLTPSNVTTNIEVYVVHTFSDVNLIQVNSCFNMLHRLLDLVFISDNIKFNVYESPFSVSPATVHHNALLIELVFYDFLPLIIDNVSSFSYDYVNCNYELLNLKINSIDWNGVLNALNLEVAFACFKRKLIDIFNELIPQIRNRKHSYLWLKKA